jgi:tungstate transport system substrate-binding protein
MVVNPEKHPHVKQKQAQQFVDWITSPEGQRVIADYKVDGEQLFFPNANAASK